MNQALSGDTGVNPDFEAYLHRTKASIHRGRREFHNAHLEAQRAVDLSGDPFSRMMLAWMKKHDGQLTEAIEILTDMLPDDESPFIVTLSLTGYLYLAGKTEQADSLLDMVPTSSDPTMIMNHAWVAACRNDLDDCVAKIELAMRAGPPAMMRTFFEMDVEFDRFRDEPSFKAALG